MKIFTYKINELKLFGNHGLYKSEKEKGQWFLISVKYSIKYDNKINDSIKSVIDYNSLCNDINNVFISKRFNLLESLLIEIRSYLKIKYPKYNFYIKIQKSNPNTDQVIKSISVKI